MSVIQELRGLLRLRILQLAGLAAFLTWAAGRAISLKYCVLDLDLYWHLGAGNWILQHHAVPHTGILSYSTASLPWVAYSWGYEVLLSLAYKGFQLMGIALFGVLLTLLVAGSVYWMLHRLSGRFWLACALAAIACWAFLFSLMPRPVFFSMVLFMVTLTRILEAQRTGRIQTLYWLPLVFVLWANLHIQFIYGLFLVGLLLGITLLQRLAGSLGVRPVFLSEPSLPLKQLAAVFFACLLATCIGPYSFHLYGVIFQYSRAKLAYSMINELQPLSFRYIEHYVQLLLTAAAFFVIGWQKKIDPFKLALLIVASLVSYRTMRDSWFICICAAACIADASFASPSPAATSRAPRHTVAEMAGVALVTSVLLLLIATNSDFNTRGLDDLISSQFPVAAVNFLRQNPPPGPLYNDLDWGGFLIWYMPNYPVAVDGRNDLYGDDLDRIFLSSEMGEKSSETNPYLNNAGVVLLRRDVPLANLLRNDPRFRLVYEDQIATVFVRG
jgi:hypothetical protein